MKHIPHIFIICIICLLIAAGLAIYNCITYINPKNNYTLDVYTDTIYNYVIVTTVANNSNNISISSIVVNDTCNFSNNN